jgi:hypothetical protein
MNFDNKRIIALDAPKSWHFPIHYLLEDLEAND